MSSVLHLVQYYQAAVIFKIVISSVANTEYSDHLRSLREGSVVIMYGVTSANPGMQVTGKVRG